jgi:hypothetical protein
MTEHGQDDGECCGGPDPAERPGVEDDHRQGLGARPVEQAGHAHLVQGSEEADRPHPEQHRHQRSQEPAEQDQQARCRRHTDGAGDRGEHGRPPARRGRTVPSPGYFFAARAPRYATVP